MSVKADWGTATVAAVPAPAAPQVDPFVVASSAMEEQSPVTVMKPTTTEGPIDLSTPVPRLQDWLGELIRREGNLFDCGTTCPLKDLPDGNCTACPVSRANETDGSVEDMRLTGLCRIGAEQERVAMLLLAQSRDQHHGG